ncbi:DNA polymerase subunit beta [Anopheles sinensis]|uniref:DNA polymerase subunit beta n=1 Tax=Anopheles sinensis TaxID=74873 RepID=A0A084WRS9_ANOSI|nr:DNA polymerase subunit beta [Anopheles sinensis]
MHPRETEREWPSQAQLQRVFGWRVDRKVAVPEQATRDRPPTKVWLVWVPVGEMVPWQASGSHHPRGK